MGAAHKALQGYKENHRVTEASWTRNHSLDIGAERELVFRKGGNNGKSGECEWNDRLVFQKEIPNKTDSVCMQNYFGERQRVVVRICCRIPELNLDTDRDVQTVITGRNSAENCLIMADSDFSDTDWRTNATEGSPDIPECHN